MTDANQHTQELPPPQLVETPDALHQMVSRVMQEPIVAVDTESNSLYAYQERVCLIQFSVPGMDYLVDPLALEDLSELGPFFESKDIEKVFHASDYDLIVLQRDYNFTCGKLFDTMWAARILGWPQVGLGDILEKYFDLHPNKKYQRYNWGRRPIKPEAIAYARTDTHYLIALREIQLAKLQTQGRWEETQEVFAYLRTHIPHPTPPDPEVTFWRIKGVQDLSTQEQHVLYQLHLWRERTAQKLDRPTMKIIGNRRLLNLSRIQPRNKEELEAAGLTSTQVRRFGTSILRALRTKFKPLPSLPPEGRRPPEAILERYQALRAWRKEIAAYRGVDSDVILPNATLWEIASHPPKELDDLLEVPSIGPWRKKTYGPDILALVAEK